MSRKTPHRRADAKATGRDQRKDEVTESIADQARQMATRIRGLPREIVSSFVCVDAVARVARVQDLANEISVGFLPVIGWIERRRSGETSELVKARLHYALDEAFTCVQLEIPEYAGGRIKSHVVEPSAGAQRTAELSAVTLAFEKELLEWANDIETDERQRAIVESETRTKRTGVGKKAKPPNVPDKYKAVVKLWPEFEREMKATQQRPLIRRFREWLKVQPVHIVLDANFENWWNNVYSRQLRRH
ncbi:MAG TPA: hypothetical protein VG122_08845 [Gemmata sp.]|nr:hypothetical protein [Gemmata sp.]